MTSGAKVWITGAAGFSGRALLEYLVGLPDADCPQIMGLDLAEVEIQGVKVQACNVFSPDAIEELAAKLEPDFVIHLAGALPPADETTLWRSNLGLTEALIRNLTSTGLSPRVVSIGSAAEYGPQGGSPVSEDAAPRPVSAYGMSKLAQGRMALLLGELCDLEVVVMRPFNIIGPKAPSSLILGKICNAIVRGDRKVTLGGTGAVRDFVDVRDVVRAYWSACLNCSAGQYYNVCSGTPVQVSELLDVVQRLTPHEIHFHTSGSGGGANNDIVVGNGQKLNAATLWRPEYGLEATVTDMLADAV